MEQFIYRGQDHAAWKFKTRLSYCQIWQHSISHMIAQAYQIENLESAQARINCNKQHIVNAFSTYSSKNGKFYLLVQRIPNRLSEVFALNQSQTLKVLYSIFKGLIELEDRYANIGLTQNCICFNQTGKVKIWINPILSSMIPSITLRQSDNQQQKIALNIYHLLLMVQRKCFNSNLLKSIIHKVSEYKITNYWQAVQEIVKIGEMLFIDVQQKYLNFAKKRQQTRIKSKNQNIPQKDVSNKYLKTQIQEPYYQKNVGNNHYRKLSNYQNNQINRFKKEGVPTSFTLNFNKFTQSQTYDDLKQNYHKSAQLSPRQNQYPPDNQQLHTQRKQKQKQKQDQNAFNKKLMICETIFEDNSQCDQSFNNPFHLDNQQKLVQGEFKTFGILEDSLDQKKSKAQEKIINYDILQQSLSRKDSDFDIKMMDLQIQKRLNKKNKDQPEKRASIKSSLHQNQHVFYQHNTNTQQKTNYQPQKQNQQKQKSISTYTGSQRNTQKQNINFGKNKQNVLTSINNNAPKQNLAYIDKKYEEYIRNQNIKKINTISENNTVPLNARKHGKHSSNLQNTSNSNILGMNTVGGYYNVLNQGNSRKPGCLQNNNQIKYIFS